MGNNWNNKYMDLAKTVSKWSKDPSAKIGSVAISSSGQVLAQGYNGFPRGINDSETRYNDREVKYSYVVHAEMNTIYNACMNGVSLSDSTFYVHGLPVCNECAKGIIQVGTKKVVMSGDMDNPRWVESCKKACDLFDEAGVKWEFI
jgi:dCMP deaminase